MLKVVKFAAKKTDMIQLAEDNNSPKWYWMSDAVQTFAHKTINAGDEVTIEGNDLKEGLLIITRITKAGAGSSQAKKETTDTGFKCGVCGKALKDDKYKKCYDCNKKAPNTSSSGGGYSKSPEDSEKIKRLSILSSVCHAIPALVGNVDLNNIGDVIETLYDKLYKKISE